MRGRAWAASAVLLALACGGARPPASQAEGASQPAIGAAAAPSGLSRPANPTERRLVDALMRETEELRGLRFLAPVEVTIEDHAAMRAYVNRALDEAQLRRARRRYLALGVLDPKLDVRELLVSVMEEELIGYYDPKEKRLAVRADIARALELGDAGTSRGLTWRATVVHELVHALQDQHFALGEAIEQLRSTDADNAFGALVEGDASLVMLGYTARLAGVSMPALAAQPERVLAAMSRTPEQLTGALRRAPALLREPLLFRYREGAYFCAELFRAGGWARIDAAHQKPPQSTLAIRHAQHYLEAREEPSLELPELGWLAAHQVEQLDQDVLGGLELSVVLNAAGVEAQSIVSAWRGDRYLVVQQHGTLGSIWWLRFASVEVAGGVAAAFTRQGDPLRRVLRRGALVLVARAIDDATYTELAARLRAAKHSAHQALPASTRAAPFGGRDQLASSGSEH